MERVIVYIDGFNFYYGLKSKGWKRYYWVDLKKLSQNILKPDGSQTLNRTKYFTARISTADKNKKKRQDTFLDALGTLSEFDIFFGHYLLKDVHCNNCGAVSKVPEEKKTDVCIATELILDAINDEFDTAILISGDSDLIPPIDAIKKKYSHKKIGVGFPPNRESNNLKRYADYSFMIRESTIRNSLFGEKIILDSGIQLKRPSQWK